MTGHFQDTVRSLDVNALETSKPIEASNNLGLPSMSDLKEKLQDFFPKELTEDVDVQEISSEASVERPVDGSLILDDGTKIELPGRAYDANPENLNASPVADNANSYISTGTETSRSDSAPFDHNDTNEVIHKGGSYADVFKDGEGDKYEVHHIPADSTTNLDRNDGPAIRMDKEDHRQTASCGNSREAREYREKQRELIDSGNFDEAVQMDIDDIHEKFGSKYDDAISEMQAYANILNPKGATL